MFPVLQSDVLLPIELIGQMILSMTILDQLRSLAYVSLFIHILLTTKCFRLKIYISNLFKCKTTFEFTSNYDCLFYKIDNFDESFCRQVSIESNHRQNVDPIGPDFQISTLALFW